MSDQPAYTPQQALNNIRLFTELHPTRNRHEEYVTSVTDICHSIMERGIEGDDAHPFHDPARDILIVLLNLRDGAKDGGRGITAEDWEAAARCVDWRAEEQD